VTSGLAGFSNAQGDRDGFALVPPTFKIPLIGKSRALVRFHRLNATLDSVKKYAFSIRSLFQSKPDTTDPYFGVFGHEIVNRHPEVGRNRLNFPVGHRNFPRPTAAIAASLALVTHPFLHVIKTHDVMIAILSKMSGNS
jgi:hypothetical protein